MAGTGISESGTTVVYSDERLTIRADNEPLISVLEKIADQAGLIIFIARGFDPGTVTLHLEDQPLEKALDRLLRGLNVARIYHEKSPGNTGLTALEIYPKDRHGGQLNVIVRAKVPEPGISKDRFARYSSMKDDVLHPQAYVHTLEYDTLVTAALAFEKKEKDAWDDIQDLKTQVNNEVDETKNQVLTLALLDRYGKFDQMQRHHMDLLEKMHRVEHFIESRTGGNMHVLTENEGGVK